MNTDWLDDFIALIETGSFSRAADRRLMSQTSLSRRIDKLEDWAGTPLIERTQPIRLTPAGTLFLEAAKNINNTLIEVQSQLSNTVLRTKTLRIATGRTLASEFFPSWYGQVNNNPSFVHMSVLSSGSEYAAIRFVNKQAELLLAYQTPMIELILAKTAYDYHVLGREIIVPVTHAKNSDELAQQLTKRTHLHKLPWLNYDKSLSLRSVVISYLSKQQILPNLHPVFESDNYETLKAMVIKGVGIAWLPYAIVRNEIIKKQLFVIGDKYLQIPVNISLYKHTDQQDEVLDAIWAQSKSLAIT